MTAVLRRELRSYLKSGYGLILAAIYLLGFGIFLTVFNLTAGDPSFSYPVSYIQPVLILLIPLMTMRALAEERENGTEEMLFALPVTTAGLVLGKYFAVLAVFAIPTAVCGLYPLLLSFLGEVSFALSYTAYLGLFLLGCALIAFCLFLSALCKTRGVAFFAGVGSLLLIYFFNVFADLLGGAPFLSDLLFGVNPFSKASALLYGQLDLTAVGFLLIMTVLFLAFTVLLVKARRGFGFLKRGAGISLGALALVIIVGAQLLLSMVPYKQSRVDVTGEDVFVITEETEAWLSGLEEDVTVYFLSDGGASHASQDLYRYLLDYTDRSPKVTLQVINPRVDTAFMKAHPGASEMSNYSLVIESARRYKMLDLYDLYYYHNEFMGLTMHPYEYMSYISAAQSGNSQSEEYTYGMYLMQYAAYTKSYFNGNSVITNAIRYTALEEVPRIFVPASNGSSVPDMAFCNEMELHGYELYSFDGLENIPEECRIMLMYMPSEDLNAAEEACLRQYLNGGGKLYLITTYTHTDMPHLMAVLAEFGLSASEEMNIVCEGETDYYVDQGENGVYPHFIWSHVASHEATGADFSGELLLRFAHSLTMTETDGVTHTKWLYTSKKGYLMTPTEDGTGTEESEPGEQIMGAIAQKGEGTVVWVTSPDALTNYGNVQSQGGNFSLAFSCFAFLSDYQGRAVELAPAQIESRYLNITGGYVTVISILTVLILPAAFLATGCYLGYARKKR